MAIILQQLQIQGPTPSTTGPEALSSPWSPGLLLSKPVILLVSDVDVISEDTHIVLILSYADNAAESHPKNAALYT